ncbi:MAG TPA: methyltransferase domain-containing protein [Actinomycetes bacterium]
MDLPVAPPSGTELSPATQGLLDTFVPAGAHCLNVVGPGGTAVAAWLDGRGCSHVDEDVARATELRFEDGSFDAALLIGVLDRLRAPRPAASELRRVLRPGGVLLVTATNGAYWRHRLDRAARAGQPRAATVSPGWLRRLLLESGFSMVGVEGGDGAFIRDLPLAGRLWTRRGSGPYRVAERLFPSLLGSSVGAFAIRV